MADTTNKIIVANWKSNKTLDEALLWLKQVGPKAADSSHTIVLCPPLPFLVPLKIAIENSNYKISLGVQDVSPFPAGSYTGAVGVVNLSGLGVTHAIVGHSERRKYFQETNQQVANKVTLLLEEGIMPIICVEETQVASQAAALESGDRKKCIVSFEPSGHIGVGNADTLDDVLKVASLIRAAFWEEAPVLYGGSVDGKNVGEFLNSSEIAGALVGTASLNATDFSSLL